MPVFLFMTWMRILVLMADGGTLAPSNGFGDNLEATGDSAACSRVRLMFEYVLGTPIRWRAEVQSGSRGV